jgi:hypothetical protein
MGELVFQVFCNLLSAVDGVPCAGEMLPHAEEGQRRMYIQVKDEA